MRQFERGRRDGAALRLSGTEETILAPGPTKFNADVFDVGSRYNDVRLSQCAETTARVSRARTLASAPDAWCCRGRERR
jgi:hypothetical protein